MSGTLNGTILVKPVLETGVGATVFTEAFACNYENEKVSTANAKVRKLMTV